LRDTDWASMAHSLEVRVPLVDTELLRSVAPIMCGTAVASGKELLGSNLAAPLWDRHRMRSKTGFGTPIAAWLENCATFLKPSRKEPWSHWSRRWLCALPGQFGFDPIQNSKPAPAARLISQKAREEFVI